MRAANGPAQWLWRWFALLGLVFLALQAVRTAVVAAESERRPALASAAWPSHPNPLLASALQEIGTAAGQGRAPPRKALDDVDRAGRVAPLAAEPFLVSATAKIAAGDLASAKVLLQAALRRDPRSPAVSFLLADLALRRGRLSDAVEALAGLQRRTGFVSAAFAPALVNFLRQPGGPREIGPVLRRNPELRAATLQQLAGEEGSLALLLWLSSPRDRSAAWLQFTVDRLIVQGRAADLSALVRRVAPDANLSRGFSGAFEPNAFGWRLPSVSGGGAERVGGTALNLTSFGRDELVLAERPLALSPGSYVLSQQLSGVGPTDRFQWRLRCPATDLAPVVAPIPLGRASATLSINSRCRTQVLQLVATAPDDPQVVSATLAKLSLEPLQ